MGHNNSTQSPWFQTILKQTLLHITHLIIWQEMCTGKRKGYSDTVQSNCCSLPEGGSSQWGTSHSHPEFPGFPSFASLLPLFCASLLSHQLQSIFNKPPLHGQHICLCQERLPLFWNRLPALLWLTTVMMMTERQNLPLPHIRQVLCVGKQQLSPRWPYSSFIWHWPSDATVTIAHVRTWTQVLQFLPKHLHSLHCS